MRVKHQYALMVYEVDINPTAVDFPYTDELPQSDLVIQTDAGGNVIGQWLTTRAYGGYIPLGAGAPSGTVSGGGTAVSSYGALSGLTPSVGDVAYVADASADPDVGNGPASYIWDGNAWRLVAPLDNGITHSFANEAARTAETGHAVTQEEIDDQAIFRDIDTGTLWLATGTAGAVVWQQIGGGDLTETFQQANAFTAGDIIYADPATGVWALADNTSENTLGSTPVLSATATEFVVPKVKGIYPRAAHGFGNAGTVLYLGTNGAITTTMPTTNEIVIVGRVYGPDRILYHLNDVSYSAGDPNRYTITQANAFAAGDIVRSNGGAWVLAQADAAANIGDVAVLSANATSFTIARYAGVTELQSHPYGAAGSDIYLSDSAAGDTVATSDQTIVVRIGYVIDADTAYFNNTGLGFG